ncbi:MAG: ferredoxin [Pseudonocardia sp. SCN 72-86]|nr:MAG: ferredoxin [Pseudonocardia sp. SCN 72-86]
MFEAGSPPASPSTRTCTLVVARRRQAADDVVELELRRPDDGPLPPWQPGAHVDLLLAPGVTRSYSLCGDPAHAHVWRIAVLRADPGRGGSARVHDDLQLGVGVEVGLPRNNFPLVPAERYVFVAGGVGITPLLPMIAAAQARAADWTLLYGGRRRSSMAYLDELAHHGPRVRIRPHDETGMLDLAPVAAEAAAGALVYCCGPEPLLAAAEAVVPAARLRTERFAPRPAGAPGGDGPFVVELRRSGRTLTVPARGSLLSTLESAGVDVPQSCREGTCGSCETRVVAGDPDHRDSVLDEAERAAGTTMMVCVSRSRGPLLVLDL